VDIDASLEWCDRRLLARIHRRTINRLRAEIEPVSPAVFLRFLMRWQHLEPGTQLHGPQGLLTVITQLQGFEAAATSWESKLLPARVADYSPEMLDLLCFSGEIAWARLTAPAAPALEAARRLVPTKAAPITFFRREDADWLLHAAGWNASTARERISAPAAQVMSWLEQRGASFFNDLVRATGESGETLLKSQIEDALWELATAGSVTADGFDNLRALLDPKRRRAEGKGRTARPRHSAGRWSLISNLLDARELPELESLDEVRARSARERAQLAEAQARQLLRRYGVIFRALMDRENAALPWHDILLACRKLEARGEIRGGRFVSGFSGEQYALPEAVEALRATRRLPPLAMARLISAADPLNLAGILVPGDRVTAQAETIVELTPADEGSGASARAAAERESVIA
jgi:ATP-dependent Lhr-like helicase